MFLNYVAIVEGFSLVGTTVGAPIGVDKHRRQNAIYQQSPLVHVVPLVKVGPLVKHFITLLWLGWSCPMPTGDVGRSRHRMDLKTIIPRSLTLAHSPGLKFQLGQLRPES